MRSDPALRQDFPARLDSRLFRNHRNPIVPGSPLQLAFGPMIRNNQGIKATHPTANSVIRRLTKPKVPKRNCRSREQDMPTYRWYDAIVEPTSGTGLN